MPPFHRAVLAHVATLRDDGPGLLRRLKPGGWWFLGSGRLYPVLYRLERLGLVKAEPTEPVRPSGARRWDYHATPDGVLWLELKAAAGDGRPPTRDEWRVICALGEIDGPATGRGLADFLEIPDGRLAKAFGALDAAGYVAVDWREAGDDTTDFRSWRYTLTPAGRQLLELRRANHGG